MALPRPLIPALIALGTLSIATPAHAAGPSALAHDPASVLTGIIAKQADPSTSLLGRDLPSTIANVKAAINPAVDPSCAAAPVSQPFKAWRDQANYVPAPGGSFEDGLAGWSARGAVSVVKDQEPWRVSGAKTDRSAVLLGPGSSLVSSSFCGGLEYPTVRLFAKATTTSVAVASVTVRFTGRDGLLYSLPLGLITAGRDWQPTRSTLTLSGVPLLTGTRLGVTVTPLIGSIALDDVYVDPFRRS